jgi:hypothetical protein
MRPGWSEGSKVPEPNRPHGQARLGLKGRSIIWLTLTILARSPLAVSAQARRLAATVVAALQRQASVSQIVNVDGGDVQCVRAIGVAQGWREFIEGLSLRSLMFELRPRSFDMVLSHVAARFTLRNQAGDDKRSLSISFSIPRVPIFVQKSRAGLLERFTAGFVSRVVFSLPTCSQRLCARSKMRSDERVAFGPSMVPKCLRREDI